MASETPELQAGNLGGRERANPKTESEREEAHDLSLFFEKLFSLLQDCSHSALLVDGMMAVHGIGVIGSH